MPFTFAHPAIILPFSQVRSRFVSVTGLVIGSMIPDFEYFFRLKVLSTISHSAEGVFLFDLPAGLLVYLCFIVFVRPELVRNLPAAIQERIPVSSREVHLKLPGSMLPVIVSILIGVISHLVWDGFTHIGGFGLDWFPALVHPIHIMGHGVPGYKLLQHLSTVIGGIAILLVFLNRPRCSASVSPSVLYWVVLLLIMVLLLAVRSFFASGQAGIGDFIVTGISGLFLGMIFAPVVLRARSSD